MYSIVIIGKKGISVLFELSLFNILCELFVFPLNTFRSVWLLTVPTRLFHMFNVKMSNECVPNFLNM